MSRVAARNVGQMVWVLCTELQVEPPSELQGGVTERVA
jgi:hypothetical protein